MATDDLPPAFDHTDLPVGLPEDVYASWLAARADLRASPDIVLAQLRFQFCHGYVQALKDAQILDEGYSSYIQSQVRDIWLELSRKFSAIP